MSEEHRREERRGEDQRMFGMKLKNLIKSPLGITAIIGSTILTFLLAYTKFNMAVDEVVKRSAPVQEQMQINVVVTTKIDSMDKKLDIIQEDVKKILRSRNLRQE